ncbi:MAG: hypothetical protein J5I92_05970 [Thiogranum sp.]|nr:hypothetical protein [Thiogranum sp.]
MNTDPLSPQLPPVAIPVRSVHTSPDQASSRPVERPHHGEAADNQNRNGTASSDAARDPRQQQPANHNRSLRQESELTPEEKREIDKLKDRDREVRAHEAVHENAAGHLARGAAEASRMQADARKELAEQHAGEQDSSVATQSMSTGRLAEPAPVGTLLDVIV